MYAARRDAANGIVCLRCARTNPADATACFFCTNTWPSAEAIEAFDPARHGVAASPVPSATAGPDVPMTLGDKLFDFSGRLGIGSYWLIMIGLLAYHAVMQLAGRALQSPGFGVAYLVSCLPLLWITLAVIVKRWQDLGLSGLWAVTSFIPFVNLIVLIGLGLMPGTVGRNRFGAGPDIKPDAGTRPATAAEVAARAAAAAGPAAGPAEAAPQKMGTCPNCRSTIALASEECPRCKAGFGVGSTWQVEPT